MAKADVISSFEDLEVFKKAYDVALRLHKVSLTFPKIEQYALADQVRRASKSVCANLAEGFAHQRSSSAEFRRYLMMAIGSCDEMRVWVRFCSDLNYIAVTDAEHFRSDYSIIARMLHKLRNNWK